jgi:hypothetical protein
MARRSEQFPVGFSVGGAAVEDGAVHQQRIQKRSQSIYHENGTHNSKIPRRPGATTPAAPKHQPLFPVMAQQLRRDLKNTQPPFF